MKKYSLTFLLISIFCCATSYAQSNYINYFLTVDSAQYLQQQEKYKEAVVVYKAALKTAEGRGSEFLSLGKCYLHLGKTKKAYKFVKKAILSGTPMRYIDRLRTINEQEVYHTDFWEKVDTKYPGLRNKFLASVDLEDYITLKTIKQSDQQVRQDLMSRDGFFSDSLQIDFAGRIDSNNLERLLELIEKNGKWPGGKSFGSAESGAYLVLLHFDQRYIKDTEKYNRIFEVLYQSAKEGVLAGELHTYQFAYWIDYHLKTTEGKQLYGVPSYKKWEKIPFQDIDKVDQLRAAIGLPPLYKVFARAGLPLPAGYQKDRL